MAKTNGVLTEKQRAFCRGVVEGKTYSDAYRDAYDTQGSPRTVGVQASKLMSKPEIRKEIDRLRKPAEDHASQLAITERDKQIEFVRGRIEECLVKGDETSTIRYTDMLNKLLNLYGTDEEKDEKKNPVVELDSDTLKRFLA